VKAKAPPKKNSKKAKAEAAAAKRAAQKSQSQKRKREEVVKPKSTPTRSSARNRTSSGAVVEQPVAKKGRPSRRSAVKDGWEEVPPGLLYDEEGNGQMEDGDDESDLSDPPPADEDTSMVESVKGEQENGDETVHSIKGELGGETKDSVQGEMDVEEPKEEDHGANGKAEIDLKKPKVEEEEWIEFETLAVTKHEWLAMSTRFAKSKHPDEKLLHQFLQAEVLPKVMADIEEAEKQRALEAALANRKRSSRIALKESEREEKERDRVARLKMEEKMAAIRAEEAQKAVKEKEEMSAAIIREERLREREERLAAREREAIEKAERDIMERENREKMREMRKMKREQLLANGGLTNESEELQQHKEQDDDSWELKCEVCGKAGINLDDTEEIVCCETCGVWQHTECWNVFDRSVGRPARDWEKEDFFCSKCKPPVPGQPWPQGPSKQLSNPPAPSIASAPIVPSQTPGSSFAMQPRPTYPNPAQQRPLNMPSSPMQPDLYSNQPVRHPMQNVHGHMQQQPMAYHQQISPYQQQTSPGSGYFNGQQPSSPSVQSFPRQPMMQPQIPPQHMQRPAPAPMVYHPSSPPTQNVQMSQPPMQMQNSPSPVLETVPRGQSGSSMSMAAPSAPINHMAVDRTSAPSTSLSSSQQASRPIAASFSQGGSSKSQSAAPTNFGSTAVRTSSTSATMQPPSTASSSSPRAPTVATSPTLMKQTSPSPKVASSSGAPRSLSVSSQPSGTFPLRHTMAKSPLSRPDGFSPPSIPQMSLGPAIARASSPTLKKSINANTKLDPLYNRQTVTSHSGSNSSVASPASTPGPTSGSLARAVPSSTSPHGHYVGNVNVVASGPTNPSPVPKAPDQPSLTRSPAFAIASDTNGQHQQTASTVAAAPSINNFAPSTQTPKLTSQVNPVVQEHQQQP